MDGPLAHPPLCVTCGYDLRGLSEGGACPECGTSISRSLRGDWLAAAAPEWLRCIARGQRFIAIGLLSGVFCVVMATVVMASFAIVVAVQPGLPRAFEDVISVLVGVALLGLPVSLCIGAVGIFLLTAQEARESDRESPWSARHVSRWGALGAIAASLAIVTVHHLPPAGRAWLIADAALKLLLIATMTIAGVALLKRLQALVRRVPDEPLAEQIEKRWRFIRWGLPAAGLYVLMLPAFRPLGFGGGMVAILGPIACVGFVALIGLLVTSIRLAGIMRQCASRFRTSLAVAENT